MKSLVKISEVNSESILMSNSLVLINSRNETMFNVVSKCRNSDKLSICKAFAKVVLTILSEENKENNTKEAQQSLNKVSHTASKLLACDLIRVTDNKGKVLPSTVKVESGDNVITPLRKVFHFTKKQPLYDAVVNKGFDFSKPEIGSMLTTWSKATLSHLTFFKRLDEAIIKASETNEIITAKETVTKTAKTVKKVAPKTAKVTDKKTAKKTA